MSKWVRESKENYIWTCRYGIALSDEYTFRYKKVHKCLQHLNEFIRNIPIFSKNEITDFPCCMPDNCKSNNPVESYRNYYNLEKRHLFAWKNREKPFWIN